MKISKITRELFKDPRLSTKQKQALDGCRKQDPNAEMLGLDGRMRPVVRVMTGIPQQPRLWAIMRNGDPTDIKWTDDDFVMPTTYEGPLDEAERHLSEPWTRATRKENS